MTQSNTAFRGVITIEQRNFEGDKLIQTWYLHSKIYSSPSPCKRYMTKQVNDLVNSEKRYREMYEQKRPMYHGRIPATYELPVHIEVQNSTGWEVYVKGK